MLKLLIDLVRARRMNRAMRQESSGDSCTACESRNVVELAPAAYRCGDCGYEGGDGYGAYKQGLRAQKFARLSPEERHAQSRDKLLNARRLLISGIGDAQHAQTMSVLDIVGVGTQAYGGVSGEGNEKHQMLTAAVGMLLEAQAEMVDVQMLTNSPMFAQWVGADMGGMDASLAAADLHFDNIFTDLLAHGRIGDVLQRAMAMHGAVNQALAQYFGEGPG